MNNEDIKKWAHHHDDVLNRALTTGQLDLLDELVEADFVEYNIGAFMTNSA